MDLRIKLSLTATQIAHIVSLCRKDFSEESIAIWSQLRTALNRKGCIDLFPPLTIEEKEVLKKYMLGRKHVRGEDEK